MAPIAEYLSHESAPSQALPDPNLGLQQVGQATEGLGNQVQESANKLQDTIRETRSLQIHAQATKGLLNAQYSAMQKTDPDEMQAAYAAGAEQVRAGIENYTQNDPLLQARSLAKFDEEGSVYQHLVNRHALALRQQNGVDNIKSGLIDLETAYQTAPDDATRAIFAGKARQLVTDGTKSVLTGGQANELYSHWAQLTTAHAAQSAIENGGALINQSLSQYHVASMSGPGPASPPLAMIGATRNVMMQHGVSPQAADKAITEAIGNSAIHNRDPRLLDMLGQLKGFDGQPLDSTQYGTDTIARATNHMDMMLTHDDRMAARESTKIAKQQEDTILSTSIAGMLKDPLHYDPTNDAKAMNGVNPEAVDKIYTSWDKIRSSRVWDRDDPQTVAKGYADIYSGDPKRIPTSDTIAGWAGSTPGSDAKISTKTLDEMLRARQAAVDRPDPRLTSPVNRAMLDSVTGPIRAGTGPFDSLADGEAKGQKIHNAYVAEADWHERENQFLKDNPDATPAKLNEYMRGQLPAFTKQYAPPNVQDEKVKQITPLTIQERVQSDTTTAEPTSHVWFKDQDELRAALHDYLSPGPDGKQSRTGALKLIEDKYHLTPTQMDRLVNTQLSNVGTEKKQP